MTIPTTAVATVTLDGESDLPGVPGFIISRFNPLVNEVARRCLSVPVVGDVSGPGTAVVLGTVFGDSTTSDTASINLVTGDVRNPLLFYQSVPTTILGNVAREYGITGPVICLSVRKDPAAELAALTDLLFLDNEIYRVLCIEVELATNPRTALLSQKRTTDVATATFLRKGAPSLVRQGQVT